MSEFYNFLKKTGYYFGRTFNTFPTTKNRPCFIAPAVAAAAAAVCVPAVLAAALCGCAVFWTLRSKVCVVWRGKEVLKLSQQALRRRLAKKTCSSQAPVRRPFLVCWLRSGTGAARGRWCLLCSLRSGHEPFLH